MFQPRIPRRSGATSEYPSLNSETETDAYSSNLTDRLFYSNPKRFRLWEVVGSSHFDYCGLSVGPNDIGNGRGAGEIVKTCG